MIVEPDDGAKLLELARSSIRGAFRHGSRPTPPCGEWSWPLTANGASFVTLTMDGALRGCCGSIVPIRPLGEDVWHNALRTAFDDPRFPALRVNEVQRCAVAIAVLGPLEMLAAGSEQALVEQLRPGVDGLLLRHGDLQATFLPKVWQQLSDPRRFLGHLKRKMGLPESYWDGAMVACRYVTVEFSGEV
jgi:AmmeMemoRadiSam system protein A